MDENEPIQEVIDDAYFIALGRFVHEFSSVEQVMSMLLSHYAGVSVDLGTALFSGVRTSEATGKLNRLFETRALEEIKSTLEPVLKQVADITSLRNDILHRGVKISYDKGMGVQKLGHVRQRDSFVTVTIKTLVDMTADLKKISHHLIWTMWGDTMSDLVWKTHFEPQIKATWRYKPVQPSTHHTKRRDTSLKPKRPPRSSLA